MLQLNVPTVSSFCSADKPQCVQVTFRGETVEIRDDKLGDASPVRTFTVDEYHAWIGQVEADVEMGMLSIPADDYLDQLSFDIDEWTAFIAGVKARELVPPGQF